MKKLEWCLEQKRGIKLISPNPTLGKDYIKKADKILDNVFSTKDEWKLITAYYACYHALYSILMHYGIKSEIHDCTLELMKVFDFSQEDIDFLQDLKNKRIQAQYYLKEVILEDESKVKAFIDKCKQIISKLKNKDIEVVRKKIKEVQHE